MSKTWKSELEDRLSRCELHVDAALAIASNDLSFRNMADVLVDVSSPAVAGAARLVGISPAVVEEWRRFLRSAAGRLDESIHRVMGEVDALHRLPPSQLFELRQHEPRELRWSQPPSREPLSLIDLPAIAIVTPSFNHAQYIGATIESVLGQDYPKLRYIVRDAGSKDGTLDVLQSYGDRLRWVSEPDGGQAAAVNAGFGEISGDIMGYLNSDDLLTPGSLFRIAEAFRRFPQVDVIYGHRILIDGDGNEIGRWSLPRHDPRAIFWADYIPQETMFWRRTVWEKLGGLDPKMRYAMDWDFILRAHEAGFRFTRLDNYLGCFRVHATQKTTAQVNVGDEEVLRLRSRHLGFGPAHTEVMDAIEGYLRAHRRWLRRRRWGL